MVKVGPYRDASGWTTWRSISQITSARAARATLGQPSVLRYSPGVGGATVCVATILDSICLLRHGFFDSPEDIPAQADR